MKLKNNSHKVVSVGEAAILPGKDIEVTSKGFENNVALNFLVKKKVLSIVKEKAPGKGK